MKNIGYLGLGVMGYGMTDNLMRKSDADTTVWGYDPVEAARERFGANGGKVAASAEELYQNCEVIFFCLPTNKIVQATVRDIIKNAKPGTIMVDMGASSPYVIQELHEEAVAAGMNLVDSPVSGGKPGADAGTLVIMCGGEKEAFEAVKPYLQMMGKTVTYMGASGCGSTAKVANNMMVGIHLLAMGEAFTFAKKAGLDPTTLYNAIHEGFAGSAVMEEKVPKAINRQFEATARIAVHLKDMNNAMELAEHLGVDLPLSKIVKEHMDWMDERGMINEDQCALVKVYEEAMGVTLG